MKRRSGSTIDDRLPTKIHRAAGRMKRPSDFLISMYADWDIKPLNLRYVHPRHVGECPPEGTVTGAALICTEDEGPFLLRPTCWRGRIPEGTATEAATTHTGGGEAFLSRPTHRDKQRDSTGDRGATHWDEQHEAAVAKRVQSIIRAYSMKFPACLWASSDAVRDILRCRVDVVLTHEEIHAAVTDSIYFRYDMGSADHNPGVEKRITEDYRKAVYNQRFPFIGVLPREINVRNHHPEHWMRWISWNEPDDSVAGASDEVDSNPSPIAWFDRGDWYRSTHDEWFDDLGIPVCISTIICDYLSDQPIDTTFTMHPAYTSFTTADRPTYVRGLYRMRRLLKEVLDYGDVYEIYRTGPERREEAIHLAALRRMLIRPRASGGSIFSLSLGDDLVSDLIASDSLICIEDVERDLPPGTVIGDAMAGDIAQKTLRELTSTTMLTYDRLDYCMSKLNLDDASHLQYTLCTLDPAEWPVNTVVTLRNWVLYYKMIHLEELP